MPLAAGPERPDEPPGRADVGSVGRLSLAGRYAAPAGPLSSAAVVPRDSQWTCEHASSDVRLHNARSKRLRGGSTRQEPEMNDVVIVRSPDRVERHACRLIVTMSRTEGR